MALAKAKEIVASNAVVVFRSISFPNSIFFNRFIVCNNARFRFFSKSYCPFCVQVKKLFANLGVTFKAIELDTECASFIPFANSFVIFRAFDFRILELILICWIVLNYNCLFSFIFRACLDKQTTYLQLIVKVFMKISA